MDMRFNLSNEDSAFRGTGQASSATPAFSLSCLFENGCHIDWEPLGPAAPATLGDRFSVETLRYHPRDNFVQFVGVDRLFHHGIDS